MLSRGRLRQSVGIPGASVLAIPSTPRKPGPSPLLGMNDRIQPLADNKPGDFTFVGHTSVFDGIRLGAVSVARWPQKLKQLHNWGGVVRVKGQGLVWGVVCRRSILGSIKSEKGKKVACPLRVGGETLPQVEEFKYPGVLFTSEGKMERESDRRIGAASSVMPSLYRSVVGKKEAKLRGKALDLPVDLRSYPHLWS